MGLNDLKTFKYHEKGEVFNDSSSNIKLYFPTYIDNNNITRKVEL